MDWMRGFIGIITIIGLAYLFSTDRKMIRWKLILWGLVLQAIFAVLLYKIPMLSTLFQVLSEAFVVFINFSNEGTQFVMGSWIENDSIGFTFAFQVLPTLIFLSAISALLYYLGILQKITYGLAWVMSKTLKLSGAESLSSAGNVFLGMTEAPILVKPYIKSMTTSELFCLMTVGLSTIAGTVLGGYVIFLAGDDTEQQVIFASYLISASLLNAPSGIIFAKILIPETQFDKINTSIQIAKESVGSNAIDAFAKGTTDGLKLAANVGAMLLTFTAFIAVVNYVLKITLGYIPLGEDTLNTFIANSTEQQFSNLSLEYIFGQIFRPLTWVMGVPWEDSLLVGSLLGQKTAINEFVAYAQLGQFKAEGLLTQKSIIIATYALCGFSNFSSIAIMVGGIGVLAPERKSDVACLGLKALLAAVLACLSTGTIAGVLLT